MPKRTRATKKTTAKKKTTTAAAKKTTRARRRSISKTTAQSGRTISESAQEEDAGSLDCAHPATVSVGNKVTRNMGDYNSLTVSIMVSMPCDPRDVRACYEETSVIVDELMADEFAKAYAGAS